MSFGFGFGFPSWRTLAGGFSPAALFVGGVPGAWYDPSDLSTLFDSSTGTTPVSMPGQGAAVPVGLMLDKSQGLVLGSELVADPGFDDPAYWTAGAGWSVTGGKAVATAVSPTTPILRGGIVSVGKFYKVTYTATVTSGSCRLESASMGYTGVTRTTSGTFTEYIFPTTGVTGNIAVLSVTTFTGTIDNISVRELPGNHAIAFNNTTARPELRARVNLLEYSEQFDNAYWTANSGGLLPFGSGSVANTTATTDPLGGNTADLIVQDTTNGVHRTRSPQFTFSPALSYNASIYIKPAGVRYIEFSIGGTTNDPPVVERILQIDLQTGTVTRNATNNSGVCQPVGNGWFRVFFTMIPPSLSAINYFSITMCSDAAYTVSFTGDGTSGLYLWGADLRPANIGANVPAYQRIADANTYDTSGFPLYLRFDGIDDSMYTPASIPFATVTSDGQARRNLLLNPTQFDVSTVWDTSSGSVTVTANTTTSPDGSVTADTLTENTANSVHAVFQLSALGAAGLNTFSVYAKASTRSWVVLRVDGASTFFDVGTGAVGAVGSGCTASITNVGNGWYRCVVSKTWAANNNCWIRLATGNGVESYTGDGTSGLYIWGAQLETGSTATAFQNIGTDKVAVFAGVRKLSDAATAILTELSDAGISNPQAFSMWAPFSTTVEYAVQSRGTAASASGQRLQIDNAAFVAPVSNTFTGIFDISGDISSARLNGVSQGTATADQGAGNFGTYPLFIGSRNNGSFWLNGQLYSLAVVGSAVSAGNIAAMESWVAGKTGIAI